MPDKSQHAAGPDEDAAVHLTEIQDAGTYSGWICKTCGKTSRHQLSHYRTARNARAHERKARREALRARGSG